MQAQQGRMEVHPAFEPSERGPVPGRVTIVTAVYNAAPTLVRCIESVLSQDYGDIEYIVMDGGSLDGTVEILKRYTSRLIWHSEQDDGIYDAWNKAIELATGSWIAFLGADDFYFPGAISAYMQLASNTDSDYVSSLVRWVQCSGKSKIKGECWSWPRFQKLMTTAHVGSMHRYSLFQKYGGFNTDYKIVGDYEFLLRSRGALRATFLDLVTVEMQAGGASDSFASLTEAFRAKTISGGRNRFWARVELWVARCKLSLRVLLSKGPGRGESEN